MGIERLQKAFQNAPATPAFVAFLTAGYPRPDVTVDCLLGLQRGGADVIEVGVPFTDPLADGTTIQHASTVALQQGMTLKKTLDLVSCARSQGLTVPVVLMGYFNPFLAFDIQKLASSAQSSGVDGLVIVDLPPEEAVTVLAVLKTHDLSFVPLVAPTSTPTRIGQLCAVASSFVYCVSVTGVTGSRNAVSGDLPSLLSLIRQHTHLPIAVGFGVSSADHVTSVAEAGATGVVVGSAIVSALTSLPPDATGHQCAQAVEEVVSRLVKGRKPGHPMLPALDAQPINTQPAAADTFHQDSKFGDFGGCYVPETLVEAHKQLWDAFNEAINDQAFVAEIKKLRENYIGGPTPLYFAERLTQRIGGAHIWFKREEMAHTGAHKINNALGQALLVKRMGKSRVIAETGAGQHGVATATACALLGLECVVYMGAEDCRRQSLNVFKMKLLGATVHPVTSGSQTLKDAINEAMRDWVTNVRNTHYIVGSAIGPHPFPTIVRYFQSVIGTEARAQFLAATNTLPDVVVACVGGGSNAIGMFSAFVNDASVKLVGVEAGGKEGISGLHSATLVAGRPGVLHGTYTFLQQSEDGQIEETHSISAGLDYPGVGPEHSFLKVSGRAEYVCATDSEALAALQLVSQTEGIIPALEPSHALHHGMQLAKQLPATSHVLINVCGRGDKDMITVAKALGYSLGVDVTL
eukprot:c9725_g1_i1.p1 GENE.c9725_g1_i1~~c9725_g1_i1.p1  ORF type:complete len:715 (+),score=241.53 c9725_g1_i1:70-2145(+)